MLWWWALLGFVPIQDAVVEAWKETVPKASSPGLLSCPSGSGGFESRRSPGSWLVAEHSCFSSGLSLQL